MTSPVPTPPPPADDSRLARLEEAVQGIRHSLGIVQWAGGFAMGAVTLIVVTLLARSYTQADQIGGLGRELSTVSATLADLKGDVAKQEGALKANQDTLLAVQLRLEGIGTALGVPQPAPPPKRSEAPSDRPPDAQQTTAQHLLESGSVISSALLEAYCRSLTGKATGGMGIVNAAPPVSLKLIVACDDAFGSTETKQPEKTAPPQKVAKPRPLGPARSPADEVKGP